MENKNFLEEMDCVGGFDLVQIHHQMERLKPIMTKNQKRLYKIRIEQRISWILEPLDPFLIYN